MYQLRIFKLKHDLLKISVDLQTAFAAGTHLAYDVLNSVYIVAMILYYPWQLD
jgi:hypothetical protein